MMNADPSVSPGFSCVWIDFDSFGLPSGVLRKSDFTT
jgi:hypothetical protein